MTLLKNLLDIIPGNGYKTWIGIAAYVVILGCWSADYIDAETAKVLLGLNTAWTGIAVGHKDAKRFEAK